MKCPGSTILGMPTLWPERASGAYREALRLIGTISPTESAILE
jgi:hypothetical protein